MGCNMTYKKGLACIFILVLLGGCVSALAGAHGWTDTVVAGAGEDTGGIAIDTSSIKSLLSSVYAVSDETSKKLSGRIGALNEAVNQHFYKQKTYENLYGPFAFAFSGQFSDERIIRGKDDWLFYNPPPSDGDTVADYQGTNLLNDTELTNLAQNVTRQYDALRARGIRLVVMVVPNKHTVYERYMPGGYGPPAEMTRADQIVTYLKDQAGIPVVYPKEDLKGPRDTYQLYSKYGTHWNNLGAFVGEQCFLGELGLPQSSLDQYTVYYDGTVSTDSIADWGGMDGYYQDDLLAKIEYQGLYEDMNVLFVGDSFRTAIIPYIESDFAQAAIIHRFDYDTSYITQDEPDVVVLQAAERYVTSLGTFSFDLGE